MATHTSHTIAGQIALAQMAINNTLANPDILARVTDYGYGAPQLQEGQQRCDAATEAANARPAVVLASRQTSKQTEAARKAARTRYTALAELARTIFQRNPEQLATLRLVGPTPNADVTFLTAAYWLFDRASKNEVVRDALAAHGFGPDKFTTGMASFHAFEQARQAQGQAKQAAHDVTQVQAAALKELKAWFGTYRRIARMALKDRPDLLELVCPPQPPTEQERAKAKAKAEAKAKEKAAAKAAKATKAAPEAPAPAAPAPTEVKPDAPAPTAATNGVAH